MFKPELLANKLFAISLIIVGLISVLASNDITAAVFLFILAFPLFFAKENHIVGGEEK